MHLQASAVSALDLKKPEAINLSAGAKSINSLKKHTELYMTQRGLYLIDMNYPPNFTEKARCLVTKDHGISSHKGEQSAVFVEENFPKTVAVPDKNGILHYGRIRRLMPLESWRLQGFTTEQFQKVAETGMSNAQLYKQAGNAVTVNVVEAIGRNLRKFDETFRKDLCYG